MAQKYFLFNKKMDFQDGLGKGITLEEHGIYLKEGYQRGSFFSPLLDSGEKGMPWHRLDLKIEQEENHKIEIFMIEIFIFASENSSDYLEEKKRFSEEEWYGEKSFFLRKSELGDEILLHGIRTRYIWFILRLQGTFHAAITKIKVIFSKQSWADYLPDVYQMEQKSFSFLERYLGIFQDLYDGVSSQIQDVSCYFDPEVTKSEYLPYLAEWIGLLDSFLWESKKLRYLVGRLAKLYRWRGTVRYLEEILELYIGSRPFIIENHQIWPFMTDFRKQERLERLYGDSGFIFTVVIGLEAKIGREDLPVIERIIENEKPAHMEGRIITLEPYIFLGWHSYLGMNSILSDFHSAVLNGQASIPFCGLKQEVENR